MSLKLVYIVLFLSVVYFVSKKIEFEYRSRSKGCKPAASISRKMLGLDFAFNMLQAMKEHRSNGFMGNIFDQNGKKTIRIDVPWQPSILTAEPENIKSILATNFDSFGLEPIRHDNLEEMFGDGIFTLDGHAWSFARSLLRPQFSRDRVSDLNLFEHHFQNMIKLIPKDESITVDMQELFFRLTNDAATEFLFGESTNSLLDGKDNFAGSFNTGQEILGKRFILADLYWLYRPSKLIEACKNVHGHIRPFVESAIRANKGHEKKKQTKMNNNNNDDNNDDLNSSSNEEEGQQTKKYVFLHQLAKKTNNPKQLQDQLLNVLLAGRDTTASLLSWTVWVLSTRSDVFEKLRKEILGTCGIHPPNYTQIRSMKYLRNVLNEVLRLWPIVPINGRMALRDTQIPVGGGKDEKSPIFVPKGTTVNYSVHYLQRDKKWYGEDADVFDPERWYHWAPEAWTYLPFNGGPRICLGQQFALNEASYTLIRLLQYYEKIENRQPNGVKELVTLIMSCHGGVHVGLTRAGDI